MRFSGTILALLVAYGTLTGRAVAAETIGVIKSVAGESLVIRGGGVVPATPGMKLEEQDVLRTGEGGSMGVILRDDSRLSLGERTELALADFDFAPAQGRFSLFLRMLRGAAVYVSGQIGKLAPEKIRFETPVATVGVRGTRFAVKIEDDFCNFGGERQ